MKPIHHEVQTQNGIPTLSDSEIEKLVSMKQTHITAIFNPQPGIQLSGRSLNLIGDRFRFREASPRGETRMFYADDPNFPHSLLCSENDLKEIEENEI